MLTPISPPNYWPLRSTSSTSVTVTAGDGTIVCTNTNNATVAIPSAANLPNRIIVVKKGASNTATVTLDPSGSETIDGATSYVLYVLNDYVMIQSDGSNWRVVGGYLTPHACTMRRMAVQSGIASSSFNKILFDTVSRDNGGLTNVANSRAILRRAGNYRIQCDVWLAAGGSDLQVVEPYIFVDGSLYQLTRNQTRTGGTYNSWGSICIEEPFAAGTIIEAYVSHLAGSDKSTLTGGQAPFMTITEVR